MKNNYNTENKSIKRSCVPKKHDSEWVKVNVPVDKGIKGIISALSEYKYLETVESCEGDNICGPWVCFKYGSYWENEWHELANFVLDFLMPHLNSLVGDDVSLKIQTTPSGNVFGELSIRPGATSRVEVALRELAHEFSVFQHHNSEYCGGIFDT